MLQVWCLLALLIPLSHGDLEIEKSYEGSQLWQVEAPEDFDKLEDVMGVEKWMEHTEGGRKVFDLLVMKDALEKMRTFMKEENLTYAPKIVDMKKAIDDANPSLEEIAELQNRAGRPVTWRAYHRMEDIHKFMDYMQLTYPDLVTVKEIGRSTEGRPLKVIVVSNKEPGNKFIWVDSGIHAREWITPAASTYVINQIVEDWEDLPPHMRKIDWHFLPITNPDGYEHTHHPNGDRFWRKNRGGQTSQYYCKGVDLNRNFGYKWGGKGVSKSPCSEVYGGTGPFSEPETKAIQDYLTGKPVDASLSFHSYGQYILYPWGYDSYRTQDDAELTRVAKEAAAKIQSQTGMSYKIGPAASTLYPAAGGSDDWAYGMLKVKYSYTIELRDTGNYGFVLPASEIISTSKDAYTFVDVVAANVAALQ